MYVVIFSSERRDVDQKGYEEMAEQMIALAQKQPGFVSVESVRDATGAGITVSYWESVEAIKQWKANSEHLMAQQLGREKWYKTFTVRICKVEREYSFST